MGELTQSGMEATIGVAIDLNVGPLGSDVVEREVYAALAWRVERQSRIDAAPVRMPLVGGTRWYSAASPRAPWSPSPLANRADREPILGHRTYLSADLNLGKTHRHESGH